VFQQVRSTVHDRDEDNKYGKDPADSAFIENTQRHPLDKKNPAHKKSGQHEKNINSKSAGIDCRKIKEVLLQDEHDRQTPPPIQIIDPAQLARAMIRSG
jgi:hypothetical protein